MAPRGVRLLVLGLAAGLSCAAPAVAEESPPALDCARTFEELKEAVTTFPGAMKASQEHWDLVQIKSAEGGEQSWWIAMYVMTQPLHYAYPMITRKLIWKDPSGKVMSERSACGYGEKAKFDKVMSEFAALDKAMTEDIEKQHPKEPGE
jgi:hypothetical protein